MSREHTTPEMWGNLEYQACPLCRSERREFLFRLRAQYRVARCTVCGLHYLNPRLPESAMQKAYRQSSYEEGRACRYADTSYNAQEPALGATLFLGQSRTLNICREIAVSRNER
jgi:hypothetical protein